MSHSLPVGDWLNVGSGPSVVPGWVSIDGSWQAWLAERPLLARAAATITGRETGHWPAGIVCLDVRQGLARPSASVAVIYSSHFIEHLTRDDARAFLHECHRVLAPGGICRIVTPDLRASVQKYVDAAPHSAAADAFIGATLLVPAGGPPPSSWLQWYRMRTQFETHKWLYDGESLSAALHAAGFRAAGVRDYLDSAIPREALALVEVRERIANGEGVVVEASR